MYQGGRRSTRSRFCFGQGIICPRRLPLALAQAIVGTIRRWWRDRHVTSPPPKGCKDSVGGGHESSAAHPRCGQNPRGAGTRRTNPIDLIHPRPEGPSIGESCLPHDSIGSQPNEKLTRRGVATAVLLGLIRHVPRGDPRRPTEQLVGPLAEVDPSFHHDEGERRPLVVDRESSSTLPSEGPSFHRCLPRREDHVVSVEDEPHRGYVRRAIHSDSGDLRGPGSLHQEGPDLLRRHRPSHEPQRTRVGEPWRSRAALGCTRGRPARRTGGRDFVLMLTGARVPSSEGLAAWFVGVVAFLCRDDSMVGIRVVRQTVRRHGIASALSDAADSWGRGRGATRVVVIAMTDRLHGCPVLQAARVPADHDGVLGPLG